VTNGPRDACSPASACCSRAARCSIRSLVWQNVAFRLLRGALKRLSKAEARDLAVDKLRRVGLTPETADLFPAELSGGMQKRVGLARAIAANPRSSSSTSRPPASTRSWPASSTS
jgi:phospholipid/cholesterol/gamma-HCH transport system ATP-binding protein